MRYTQLTKRGSICDMPILNPDSAALRPSRSYLILVATIGFFIAAAGAFATLQELSGPHHHLLNIIACPAIAAFGLVYAAHQLTWKLTARPERLYLQRLGLTAWSIPMEHVCTTNVGDWFGVVVAIADLRTGQIRANLNACSFDPEAFQQFAEYLDNARNLRGVALKDGEPKPEPTWAELVSGLLVMPPLLFLGAVFSLSVDVWRRHLDMTEIMRRAAWGIGLPLAILAVLLGIIWTLKQLERPNVGEAE